MARTPLERKPRSMLAAERRLRRQSPVTQRSTSDMAICATTRKLRRVQKRPGRARTSSPLRAVEGKRQAAVQAGRSPNNAPVMRLRRKVKTRTLASTPTLRSRVTGAENGSGELVAQTEMSIPRRPPTRERRMLSVRTWRRSCARVAPRAMRTAISCWRPAACARKRLATLAQAMRRTRKTTSMRVERKSRKTLLSRGGSEPACSKRKPRFLSVSGWAAAKRCARRFNSAEASDCVAPGLRRAATTIQ